MEGMEGTGPISMGGTLQHLLHIVDHEGRSGGKEEAELGENIDVLAQVERFVALRRLQCKRATS